MQKIILFLLVVFIMTSCGQTATIKIKNSNKDSSITTEDDVTPNINKFFFYKITTWKFLFEYIRFLKDIKNGNYDVVHMHLPVAGWMGVVAKMFTTKKTKYIYSEHNLVNFYTKYNYYLSGWTYGFFDSVIYVSHEVGEVIRKMQKGWFFKTNYPVRY